MLLGLGVVLFRRGKGVAIMERLLQNVARFLHLGQFGILFRSYEITKISRSSFTMFYRIERDGKTTAEGETVLICFDYEKRKPRRLDGLFLERLESFEDVPNRSLQKASTT